LKPSFGRDHHEIPVGILGSIIALIAVSLTRKTAVSLKILHVLDHSLPLHSGYAFRSQSIFRAQLKKGWSPVAVTSPKHEQSWKGDWRESELIDGVRYYRSGLSAFNKLPIVGEIVLMARLARQIRRVAKMERARILHVHSPILNALPALWVSRQIGIPMVYEVRASWEDAAVDHGTYRTRSWKYDATRSLETWVCRGVDQVVAICAGLQEDLISRGVPAKKIAVVHNGVDVLGFKDAKADTELRRAWDLDKKNVIAFVGSFYRYEGLDLLIEAMAELSRTTKDITLLLIGGGKVESELKAKIDKLDMGSHVIMAGRISHDKIPGAYALADVLVYPRYSTRLTELVTPLKPLEAMAMGKIVVASDVGGHRELIRDGYNGMLFKANDVSALTATLHRVLDDPALRQTLGRQALSWVTRERSWDKTTAAYSASYAAALARTSLN
jgi:PEP-CTERM/exosortase A-associated glycosyltransferase